VKLGVTHVIGETTVGEEFAFARLYHAKRLGRPAPRAAKLVLLGPPPPPPPPPHLKLAALAARLGLTLAQLKNRMYRHGWKRRDLEALVAW
jgi:hypothetical protein